MVDVFDAVDEICERLARNRLDLAKMEDGLDLAVVYLATCVVVAQRLQRVGPQVARHHVEAARPMVVYVRWRIVQIASEETLDECLIEELIRAAGREIRHRALCGLAHHRSVAVRTDANHRGRLQANENRKTNSD